MSSSFVTFYFVPLTEFEFLIMAGVSQIVKKYYEGRSVLLLPSHPRVKNKMERYYSQFDEVVKLPFCTYNFNLVKGYRAFLACRKIIKHYPFAQNSILFMVSSRQLIQMLILNYFKKRCRDKAPVFVQIFPYAENKENMKLDFMTSIMMNCYSLFIRKFILCIRDKEQPSYYGYWTRPDWDARIYIEHTGNNGNFTTFQNVPFPIDFIKRENVRFLSFVCLKGNAVIFFLDSTLPRLHGISDAQYWKVTNEMIESIICNNPDINVYVKLHPNCDESDVEGIELKNIIVLEKDIAAEEYYIANQDKIVAVFSTASTALLSASWMGIPAYNFSDMVGYKGILRERFIKYLLPGNNIKHLKNMNGVRNLDLRDTKNDSVSLEINLAKWKHVFDTIITKLKYNR